MRWAYGVTTVPERGETYLPRTLSSLAAAGFTDPMLFLDGGVGRYPRMGAFGNFHMGLLELVIRNPDCARYAMFQDDVLAVKDLREYLTRCKYPDGRDGRPTGYWNLFSFLNNDQEVCGRTGWVEGAIMVSRPDDRLQTGRGALGYVFSREAAIVLLSSVTMNQKHIDISGFRERCVDGAVVTAFNYARSEELPTGWREYVHGPSLVQHHGRHSSLGTGKDWSLPNGGVKGSENWRGEDWSPLSLLS